MSADVSVVIPTYNRLWSLPATIDSCRGARCKVEIIVVDDGSTDGTWEWLQTQSDLLVMRQENQGQTWAVNAGVRLATGRYVRFLDSDDLLDPGIIDLQLAAAVESGADLVYSRVGELRESQGTIFEGVELPDWDDFIAVQLGEGQGSHYLGMLFARHLVDRVPRRPDFSMRDDRMFLLEVALLEPRLARVPGRAGLWRKHDRQMHDRYAGMELVVAHWQYLTIYKRILRELARRGTLTPRRRGVAAVAMWLLAHEIAKTHPREAAEVAAWATRLDLTFRIPQRGALGQLYRSLGFSSTETLLRWRRAIASRFRRVPMRSIHEFPL